MHDGFSGPRGRLANQRGAGLSASVSTVVDVADGPGNERPAMNPNNRFRRVSAACLPLAIILAYFVTFPVSSPAGASAIEPTVYVVNNGTNSVTPINPMTNAAGTPITGGGISFPFGAAITPNGQATYVTNYSSGVGTSVTPIVTATNTSGTAITVGTGPAGIAITPNGQTAYVANTDLEP